MPETDVPELYEEFERRLEQRSLPEAVEYAVKIDDLEPAPSSLVADLRTAIDDGDYDQAEMLLSKLSERYDSLSNEEAELVNRSLATRDKADIPMDERSRLHEHGQQFTATQTKRATFLLEVATFLAEREDRDPSEVTSSADSLQKKESDLDQKKTEAKDITESKTIPADVRVVATNGPDSLRESGTGQVVVTLNNAGDADAHGVSVTVGSESGLAASTSSLDFGTIPATTSDTRSFLVTAVGSGTGSLSLDITSDDAGSASDVVEVNIVDDTDTIPEAIVGPDSNTIATPQIQQAVVYWSKDDPVPGTGGKTIDTDTLQELIEKWGTGEPI